MVTKLNKVGISEAIRDLLKADRTTLYGNGKLLNYITVDPLEFAEAKVANNRPFALYIWTETDDTIEERASNTYESYATGVRLRGKLSNTFDAIKRLDNIWEQVKELIRANAASGDMLKSYFTDDNALIYSWGPMASDLPTPDTIDGEFIAECNGAIEVFINRY